MYDAQNRAISAGHPFYGMTGPRGHCGLRARHAMSADQIASDIVQQGVLMARVVLELGVALYGCRLGSATKLTRGLPAGHPEPL
jgi:hypothetical protein